MIQKTKGKLKVLYMSHVVYLKLTFSLIMIAFFYALHKGELKYIIDVLKVAQEIISILCTGA